MKWSRRTFVVAAAGVTISGSAAAILGLQPQLRSLTARALTPQLDDSGFEGGLTEGELANLTALGTVLIPTDDTPGATEAWVRDFVDGKVALKPGYLSEFRRASELLNEIARREEPGVQAFSRLSGDAAGRAVQQFFDSERPQPQGLRRLEVLIPDRRAKVNFWRFVVQEMLADFYASSGGWAVIGYSRYPGVGRDPREYTRLPQLTS